MDYAAISKMLTTDGYIQVNKYLIRNLGLHEAILIGELCAEYNYWEQQNKLINGMFYSTRDNIEYHTGLNSHFQRKALETLINASIIEIHKMGLPATNYYKINFDKLFMCLTTRGAGGEALEVQEVNINNNNINNINNNSISKLIEEDKSSEIISSDTLSSKDITNIDEENNLLKIDEEKQYQLKSGKIISKNTKSPKYISEYIQNLTQINNCEVNGQFIQSLLTWYYGVGVGITSIIQLERKLIKIFNECNNDLNKVIQSIDTAFVNNWKAFYTSPTTYTKKKTQAELEQDSGIIASNFLLEHGRPFDAETDAARDKNGKIITF